jgi:superfamily I DNA and/or RNA helicase
VKYTESDDGRLANDIKNLANKIGTINTKIIKSNEQQVDDEDEFSESESSKIEEILETLEAYVNKEYEIEDAKARAEKPFVYTDFKAEDIASTYKYYYRITLLKEDIKRLRELNPSMLQIKKTDETFMDLEVFNIKPDNSPNDIVVTTSFQTDRSMIDSSNELYLVAIPTLQKVRQRVIDDLRGKVSPNKWLIPLAAGVYKFKRTIKESVPEYNKERPLLPAQKDGVDKGAGSEDITLVLGPPGTGKTTVILSWVKYFVAQGKKILVTSQSNMAVDKVLIRLDEEKEFECLRVGNESKVMREAHGLLLENYALNAQAKLVESLSDVMMSLQSSKTYLSTLNASLRELLQYNAKEIKFTSEISNYKKV